MKGTWKGIKTSYPANSMSVVRKFLMDNKYKGFRLGPYMRASGDSNVMVYTDEHNWLMFVLKYGKEMDDTVAQLISNRRWQHGWDLAGKGFKKGEAAVFLAGRSLGKSKVQELYLNEILKDGNSSNRTVYANFERSPHRPRVHKI